jgi:hypothetical protein
MMSIRATLLALACIVVGVLIGSMWQDNSLRAQSSRFRTERHGELLFIRYFNSVNGVECFVGMDATGIVSVPCDREPNRK